MNSASLTQVSAKSEAASQKAARAAAAATQTLQGVRSPAPAGPGVPQFMQSAADPQSLMSSPGDSDALMSTLPMPVESSLETAADGQECSEDTEAADGSEAEEDTEAADGPDADSETEGEGETESEGEERGSDRDTAARGTAAAEDEEATGLDLLSTGDLALIDEELAEHQRWGAALSQVGTAGSTERAGFIAEAAGSGLISGAGSGAAMGLGMGLASRAATKGAAMATARWGTRIASNAARFTPVPAVGAIIGGAMSAYSLATRDWSATAATIGLFGEGNSTYEVLANSLASISEIIDVVSNILNVVAGIMGVISAAMWVATVLSAGTLSPLAVTLTNIALGISVATGIMDAINTIVLQPCIVLFRTLHTFTTEADPREVEAQQGQISQAAGAVGGAIGSAAGARTSQVGGGRPRPHAETDIPDMPSAAAGDGPTVRYEAPPRPAAEPASTPSATAPAAPAQTQPTPTPSETGPLRITDTEGPAASPRATTAEAPSPTPAHQPAVPPPTTTSAEPQQLSLLGEPATPAPTSPSPTTQPAVVPAAPARAEIAGTQLELPFPGSVHERPGQWVVSEPRPGHEQFGPQYHLPGERPTGTAPQGRPEFYDPSNPQLHENWSYGASVPNRGTLGHNVQRDHVIAQAKLRDILGDDYRAGPPPRNPSHRPRSHVAHSLTVLAETGAISPTQAHPHTQATFRDQQADVPEIDRLRAQGGPDAISSDIVEPSLEARRRSGYQDETALTHAALDQLGRAFQTRRMGERSQVPLEDSHGRPILDEQGNPQMVPLVDRNGNPLESVADRLAELQQQRGEAVTPIPDVDAMNWSDFEPSGSTPSSIPPASSGDGGATPSVASQPASGPTGTSPAGDTGHLQISQPGSSRSQRPLTSEEFARYAQTAEQMGVPDDKIVAGPYTAYDPSTGTLIIGPDIHALPAGQRPADLANPANAALDPRAVLSHEVVGHQQAAEAGQTHGLGRTFEEAQASHRAALLDPDLSPEQRRLLMEDAFARTRGEDMSDTVYMYMEPAPAAGQPPSPSMASVPRSEPSVIINEAALSPQPDAAATPTPATSRTIPSLLSTWALGNRAATLARQASAESASPAPPGQTTLPPFLAGGSSAAPVAPTAATLSPYEQAQATHRAQFTVDNQPIQGVERVNPNYPSPPGTPTQLGAIQEEIAILLAARAQAEETQARMEQQMAHHEANQAPIQAAQAETTASISAVQAHREAVARREQANQEQQQRQQEAQGLIGQYENRQAGMTALTVPLQAFRGVTHLASYLPGRAGRAMDEMNNDANRILAAFDQMDAQMAEQSATQPERQTDLQTDQTRLETTDAVAETSGQTYETALSDAVSLQERNNASMAQAQSHADAAAEARDAAEADITTREQQAQTLAAQMQSWAQAHQAARQAAIAATQARLQEGGATITDVSEV